MSDKKVAYSLVGVSKVYHQKKKEIKALDLVNIEIAANDYVSIQGPTGGGKSTLLQMLGLLDSPSNGAIELDGEFLNELSDSKLGELRAKKIGFVFQNYNLIPTLSAIENVETALVPLEVDKHKRRALALNALEKVSLSDRANHLPSELSGGQQQRVAIARAIVKSPQIILADEPTGNLDEATREEIVAVLEKLWKEEGITLIVVTHDSAVAKRAKKHLYINEGKVSLKS
jgi:putative ABC transport system ATP-binding protein